MKLVQWLLALPHFILKTRFNYFHDFGHQRFCFQTFDNIGFFMDISYVHEVLLVNLLSNNWYFNTTCVFFMVESSRITWTTPTYQNLVFFSNRVVMYLTFYAEERNVIPIEPPWPFGIVLAPYSLYTQLLVKYYKTEQEKTSELFGAVCVVDQTSTSVDFFHYLSSCS